MKMRKGYLLVEMLTVVAVFGLLAVILAPFLRAIVYEIPRGWRLVQENSAMTNLVAHVRDDIRSAGGLSGSDGGTLLIETRDGLVSYEIRDGLVERRVVRQGRQQSEPAGSWKMPHGKIAWNVWRKDSAGYAAELSTHIEDRDFGQESRKMVNSYLFFVGAGK